MAWSLLCSLRLGLRESISKLCTFVVVEYFVSFCFAFVLFETGFLCVTALALGPILKPTLYTRLTQELTEIPLPLYDECWDYRPVPPHPAQVWAFLTLIMKPFYISQRSLK
jgi:hypothetical protein